MDALTELTLVLDRICVGTGGGLTFEMTSPCGVFPVLGQPLDDGRLGRVTVVLDPAHYAESVAEELFEPLDDLAPEGELWIGGSVAKHLLDPGALGPLDAPWANAELDPACGANLVRVALGAHPVEVAWWYGGDSKREDEGITALDLILDPSCDPMSADSPVRNLEEIIREFRNQHGPPSARS